MSTPSIQYESVKRTLSVVSGPPRRRFPLPQNSPIQFVAYAFDQELEMLLSNFPPAPKNTPSNASVAGQAVFAGLLDANAILTKLTQPAPTGGGKGKFAASFAVVPASWDDFQSQVVNYPGWLNLFYSNQFRDPLPLETTIRLHYDYFVVDPDAVLAGNRVNDSGNFAIKTVTSKGLIPSLFAKHWLATDGVNIVPNDFAKALVPAAGVGNYLPTVPTIEQYRSWCTVAAAFIAAANVNWDNANPPAWDGASKVDILSGQFQFADSKLIDYEGNIVARVTPFALVQ